MSETVTEEEQTQTLHKENQIFADMPIHKAVAAISLCLPVYNMMAGFSNLFGVGGAPAFNTIFPSSAFTDRRRCGKY